jgi:hypothetical protein
MIIFLKKYIEMIFFLFFKIDFLYHHIKIIQKHQLAPQPDQRVWVWLRSETQYHKKIKLEIS